MVIAGKRGQAIKLAFPAFASLAGIKRIVAVLKPVVKSLGSASTCFILVHGTFARNLGWMSQDSILVKTLQSFVPDSHVLAFCWNGLAQQTSRYQASRELSRELSELSAVYENLVVIGHSHGGNIGLQAIQAIPDKDIRLISIATPFFRLRWTNPRTAITELFIALVTLFTLSAFAGIAIYTARYYEVPVGATLIAVAILIGGLVSCFRIRDAIGAHIDARRQPYADLTVRRPIRLLVLYLERDDVVEDEVSQLFRVLQDRFTQLLGISSRAKAAALKDTPNLHALHPLRLPILLFLFGVVLAIVGVNAIYVLTVFTLMAMAVVIYLSVGAFRGVWSVVSGAITSALWPIYSAFQSGNVLDPFFVFVRVSDFPRVQAGCGAIVTARPIRFSDAPSFLHRLRKRNWLHNAICESQKAMLEITAWLARSGIASPSLDV